MAPVQMRPAGATAYRCRMAVTVSTLFVPVHDLDAAPRFYRDALGPEASNGGPADCASQMTTR